MRAAAPLIGVSIFLGIALGGTLMWAFQLREPGHHWYDTFIEHTPDWFVALFTLALTVSTTYLWLATKDIVSDARDNAKTLISMERPYVTGGGDFVRKDTGGVELFRLDVENHGKTAAFMTGYDLQFAKLADLMNDPKVKPVRKNYYRHMDGISPIGARKEIFTQIPMEEGADVVFGAIYYKDPILGEEHDSRFLLRIAPVRDIRNEGLTRLDVKDVSEEYWSWDYRKKNE